MKTVVLTEAAIQHLLQRQDALAEFPHLRALKHRLRPGRPSCCGRKHASYGLLRQAKTSFVGLPGDRLRKLKQLLKADSLVVYVAGPKGPSKLTL